MIEVLWHGRGGQGAFTAARLLGAACSMAEGRYALAFPSFGPERRGAPMRAFTKMSREPIGDRSAIVRADYVVYLDETLLADDWRDEVKPDGLVLVNSARVFDAPRIMALDADGISAAILGRPIPNTVFLGALSALCERVALEDVEEAVRQYMPPKLHEKNLRIVQAAREQVAARQFPACHPEYSAEASSSCHPERRPQAEVEGSRAASAEGASGLAAHAGSFDCAPFGRSAQDDKGDAPIRPASLIPTLRSGELDPAFYARTTCFEAGYLTVKNAGWRNIRPVVDASACTGCLQCYLYCPDGTVFKVAGPAHDGAPVAIDYDFCKGCGICAQMCKFGAIAMIPESEADAQLPRHPERSAEGEPSCHPERSAESESPCHPERSAEGAESKDPVRRQPVDKGTQQQESEADAR